MSCRNAGISCGIIKERGTKSCPKFFKKWNLKCNKSMGTFQTTAPQRPQLSPAMMNGNSFPPFLWKYPSTGPVTTSLREHPVGLHTSFSTSSLHCHVLLGMFALFAQLFPSLSQAKWMLSQPAALLCCLLSFWLSEGLPVNSWEIRGVRRWS